MTKKAAVENKPASDLVVHEPQKLELSKLSFAEYNPRTITAEELGRLKASIKKHGLVLNFVVQKRSKEHGKPLVVIGGHQRLRAVRELCAELGREPPSHGWGVVLDVSDAAARGLNVALNSIEGDWDTSKLGDLFKYLKDAGELDLSTVGFDLAEVDELVRQASEGADELASRLEREAEEGIQSFARSVTLTVEFATVEDRDRAKALLKERGGMKPGSYVLGLLEKAPAPKKKPAAA